MDDYPGAFFPASFVILHCPFDRCAIEEPFSVSTALLQHLADAHNAVVSEPETVLPYLDKYLAAVVPRHAPASSDTPRVYGGDQDLRERLQQERLRQILQTQDQERHSSHHQPRDCLFCPQPCVSKPDLFAHMFAAHAFNIGQLDNLVLVDEMLDLLESRLQRYTCVYCEKQFANSTKMRKHMRNKAHFGVHKKNHAYDRFYVVNYVHAGRLWSRTDEAERDDPVPAAEQDSDWDDLDEELDQRTMCLFCDRVFDEPNDALFAHMRDAHHFDFVQALANERDDEYAQIKMVNYIRNRIGRIICVSCDAQFVLADQLAAHLASMDHCAQIPREKWCTPEHLFPIFEDDPLLCLLADSAG